MKHITYLYRSKNVLFMTVNDITSKREEFISIAMWHKIQRDEAEDVVQDVYLKLCQMQCKEGSIDRIYWKGELNMVYIFTMIRNIIATKKKKASRTVYVEQYFNEGQIEQPGTLIKEVDVVLQKEGAFYHKLYVAYFNDKISMRKLAKETNIGTQTIYQGIKHIKTKLKAII